MRKVALLVGSSEYEPGLAALPSAAKDVEAMQRVLRHPEMGEFDEVIALINKPRQEIEDAIYTLFADRQKDDLLLLYFSGHGITVDSGEFYLSTRSTVKDGSKLRPTTAVAARDIHGWMNGSKSKRQVVILDCCFSGAFAKGMTAKGEVKVHEQLGGEGRALLTASTSTQYAFEQEAFDLSIYTHFLVEGLEKGAADRDGDGVISVDELHEYVRGKVQEASPAMTPEFYPVREGHKILLAKSPKDDPKLKYRKEAELRLIENEGFSEFALEILSDLQQKSGLSLEEAAEIREEVLSPYIEYKRRLKKYEATLTKAVRKQFPFSAATEMDLQYFRQYLGLKESDAETIEARTIEPKQVRASRKLQQTNINQREIQELKLYPLETKTQPIKMQPFEFETATLKIVRKPGLFGEKTALEVIRSRRQAEGFAEDLGNGVTLDVVAIQGGSFPMGSPVNEPGRKDNEDPEHLVTVQPFFMGKYAVTQAQWRSVAQLSKINLDLELAPSRFKGNDHPVEQVSWLAANEFCQRLSHK